MQVVIYNALFSVIGSEFWRVCECLNIVNTSQCFACIIPLHIAWYIDERRERLIFVNNSVIYFHRG